MACLLLHGDTKTKIKGAPSEIAFATTCHAHWIIFGVPGVKLLLAEVAFRQVGELVGPQVHKAGLGELRRFVVVECGLG